MIGILIGSFLGSILVTTTKAVELEYSYQLANIESYLANIESYLYRIEKDTDNIETYVTRIYRNMD
ncbi:MAG: hypothetical protein KJ770_08455 [Actinobacteria bacterium]|nr:hypothetical protein [Actinomycetota bacterium]